MPIQAQPKQLQAQEVRQFSGVNLRAEPSELQLGELARSINADLHTKPGTIVARNGIEIIKSLNDKPVSNIVRFGSVLTYVAGTKIYENDNLVSSSLTELSAESYTSLISYQSLNDSESRTFVANKAVMGRIQNGTLFQWGISAPGTPAVNLGPTSIGDEFTDDYRFVYTYARKEGQSLVSESNPSIESDVFTDSSYEQFGGSNLVVSVTASDDPQVTHIRIYRRSTGVIHLFDTEVPNVTGSVTITTPDIALGSAAPSGNDIPPLADLAVVHNDRVFLANSEDNRLYWSNKFQPEYFVSFIDIGPTHDKIKALVSIGGILGVFTEETKYRVVEHLDSVTAIGSGIPYIGGGGVDFTAIEALSKRGTRSPGAIVNVGGATIFPSKDGIFSTDFAGPDQLISRQIEPIFLATNVRDVPPIDWQYAQQMRAELFKGRYYLSYRGIGIEDTDKVAVYSLENQSWYFYDKDTTELYYDEERDIYYSGTSTGNIETIENPLGSEVIETTVETASLSGQSQFQRKLFLYVMVDALVSPGETLTTEVLIDSVSRYVLSITGNRRRLLHRLPPGLRGHTCGAKFTISGNGKTEIYGWRATWLPMEIQ